MSKIIGGILALIGALLLALGIGPVYTLFNDVLPLPEINKIYFSIGGLIFVVLGIVFFKMSSEEGKIRNEVPIYHKKKNQVVGYRRTK